MTNKIVENLKKLSKMGNIAEEADLSTDHETHEAVLQKLGSRVLRDFNNDSNSMSEWLEDVKKVNELVSMASKKKNTPLPNSSNIKYPLITQAIYQFSSNTYPEIIRDGKVVQGRVIGEDIFDEWQESCENVSNYMNYQLLFENEEWELELDHLLNRLAMIGFLCKKTFYDPVTKEIRSILCEPEDLIIHSDVKSLKDANRISHVLHYRLNDVLSLVTKGLFIREPIEELVDRFREGEPNPKVELIEQHCFADLDNDDYAEPYIVTIIKESGKIVRIVSRFDSDDIETENGELLLIKPDICFTDFHFLVSPKGKFQSVGFGILMLHLNETINSVFNQLVDAGQLANLRGGYRDSRLKNMGSGDSLHDPGEWKSVKVMAGATLKEGMVPIDYKEPSSVLYQLLGLMIQTGKDLSSSTEVMTGATSADNAKTGAVQLLQQAGIKVHTSIQRRVHRSLTDEFRKIYRLDSIYLDPIKYFNILGKKKAVKRKDFDIKHIHILPVADPNLSSDYQRGQKNQILMGIMQLPGVNVPVVVRKIIENSNVGIPIDQIIMPQQQPKPDPAMIKIQAEIQSWSDDKKLKAEEIHIKQQLAKLEWFKTESQLLVDRSKALLNIAQAQGVQDNGKFKEYQLQLDTLSEHFDAMKDAATFAQQNMMHNNEMGAKQQELNQNQQQLDQNQQEIDNDKSEDNQQDDSGMAGESGDAPSDSAS